MSYEYKAKKQYSFHLTKPSKSHETSAKGRNCWTHNYITVCNETS